MQDTEGNELGENELDDFEGEGEEYEEYSEEE